ncbi:hypothetical protein BDV06DRAFT_133555 [Aspergillus oleicola]
MEVIGGISTVISLLDASIELFKSTQKDFKLSEMVETVGRQLPIMRNTLEGCYTHLQSRRDTIPEDVAEALEKILDACETKANNMKKIFAKIIPDESNSWQKRYLAILRRLGKGNKVEELMRAITEDIQIIVNHDAVRSADSEQNSQLEQILEELKSLDSSVPQEDQSDMIFTSHGPQRNFIHKGHGAWMSGDGSQYNAQEQNFSIVVEAQEDFSFHEPAGTCLSRAPYIASELFIGRDKELDMIEEMLQPLPESQEQQRLVLGGMGGIGKTQLAIAYAKSGRQSYNSIFWLNAGSEATLKDSFLSIVKQIIRVQQPDKLKAEDAVIHTCQWLSDIRNTRWLLIFDNYDDPNEFEIERYYPHASHGVILITTRQPNLVAGKKIPIQPIQNIEDSLMILQSRSKREKSDIDTHARRLAERLAGLPLALATAGAFLQHSTLTFKRYLEEYEKHWNINPRRPTRLEEYQNRTLFTTWDLSYSRVKEVDPDAAKLLKLLAYFSNYSLWHGLFHAGLTDTSPKWLYNMVDNDVSFDSVMKTLTDHCFLEVQTSMSSWSMHICMHDWTLTVLNKDIDSKQYWYAFNCVAASIPSDSMDSLGHPSFFRLTAHATRLVHQHFLQSITLDKAVPGRLKDILRIATLLHKQVKLVAAEEMYQRALAVYKKALGHDHISTLDIVNNLGTLYSDQGKLKEAKEMYQQALAGYKKTRGPDFISTLSTISNLGTLYKNQGKLREAGEMYQQALAGKEKALGPKHTSTLITVNNLGCLYRDQGKLKEAEEMYQRALAGCERALGPDHTSTLLIVNNLGLLYRDQGKLKEAEEMYQQALAGWKKALGPDHTSTLLTVNNLGLLYRDQGKLKEAEEMYQQALAGWEKTLGPDHTSTLLTVDNLGLLYSDQGRLKEAEEMYQRALTGCEKALGPDHTSTLDTVHNLGLLYSDQGKLKEAEEMYQRALTGCEKALGPDHTSTLLTVNNLGLLYSDQGKLKEAEEMYQRALAGCEKGLGPDHTSTLLIVNNLGCLYRDQGKLKEAEEMYQRALAGYKKALGPDHPKTCLMAENLSSLASSSVGRDSSYLIHQDRHAAQVLEANIPQSYVQERPRRRNLLHRIFRRK